MTVLHHARSWVRPASPSSGWHEGRFFEDSTGKRGCAGPVRWKPVLNVLAMTLEGRLPTAENYCKPTESETPKFGYSHKVG